MHPKLPITGGIWQPLLPAALPRARHGSLSQSPSGTILIPPIAGGKYPQNTFLLYDLSGKYTNQVERWRCRVPPCVYDSALILLCLTFPHLLTPPLRAKFRRWEREVGHEWVLPKAVGFLVDFDEERFTLASSSYNSSPGRWNVVCAGAVSLESP